MKNKYIFKPPAKLPLKLARGKYESILMYKWRALNAYYTAREYPSMSPAQLGKIYSISERRARIYRNQHDVVVDAHLACGFEPPPKEDMPRRVGRYHHYTYREMRKIRKWPLGNTKVGRKTLFL